MGVASCVLLEPLVCCVSEQIMATDGAAAGEGGGGVPKWVIGVAVGVPVAAALIYILFGPSGEPKKKPKKAGQAEQTKQEVKSHGKDAKPVEEAKPVKVEETKVTPEQVVIEDVPEEPTDPLEKAVAAKNRGNKYF